MGMMISESASITKSLRGAVAYQAKSRIKVEDDDHESNIKKGEKFYLKKLGQKHYLIDLEKDGGKTVMYQFGIDAKTYESLAKKHENTDERPEFKNRRAQAARRNKAQTSKKKRNIPSEREAALEKKRASVGKGKSPEERKILLQIFDAEQEQTDPYIEDAKFNRLNKKIDSLKTKLKNLGESNPKSSGSKANSKDLQSADTIKAFKAAFKEAGLNVKVTKNKMTDGISIGFNGKPGASAVEKAFGELAKNVTGTIYAKEISRVSGGKGKPSTAKKEFIITNKRTTGSPQGLAYKITKSGAVSEGKKPKK